jgi:hypothetical protein
MDVVNEENVARMKRYDRVLAKLNKRLKATENKAGYAQVLHGELLLQKERVLELIARNTSC